MIDWLPTEWRTAVTATIVGNALLAVLVYVSSTLFKSTIEHSIRGKFDTDIENLKGDIHRREVLLHDELNKKGEQISDIRAGALSNLARRYESLDKRRLEAIERIWVSVIDLGKRRSCVEFSRSIKMDYAIDAAAKKDEMGEKIRKFASTIWNISGLDKIADTEIPDKERPFVPPLVWALFSAYRLVMGYPVAQLAAMRTGVGSQLLADPKPMLDLIKAALPNKIAFIDKYGVSGLPFLVDELENAILAAIQNSLHDGSSFQGNIEQAAVIIAAADRVGEANVQNIEIPPDLRR